MGLRVRARHAAPVLRPLGVLVHGDVARAAVAHAVGRREAVRGEALVRARVRVRAGVRVWVRAGVRVRVSDPSRRGSGRVG